MDSSLFSDSRYWSAFLVGLLGGVHCLGMCGGIIGAITLGSARPYNTTSHTTHKRFPILLAYNVGRIASYTLAGTLAGALTAAALSLTELRHTQQLLQIVAALFMVALGLYLGGFWQGIAYLEKSGAVLWRQIEPLSRRFMPVRSPWQAIPFGMIWGWLPCGLVYSVLIWSLSAGSALEGALLMLAFGLGTLPNLLLMGLLANQLTRFIRHPWVRRLAGISVSLLGLLMLWQVLQTLSQP